MNKRLSDCKFDTNPYTINMVKRYWVDCDESGSIFVLLVSSLVKLLDLTNKLWYFEDREK